jgi:hypothetical protein
VDAKLASLRTEVLTHIDKVPDTLHDSIEADVVNDLKNDPAFIAQVKAQIESKVTPPGLNPRPHTIPVNLGVLIGGLCLLSGFAMGRRNTVISVIRRLLIGSRRF